MISVVIPTYNSASKLANSIQSLLDQNSHEWQLVIVNDGSEDATEEFVKPYLFDPRIVYLKIDNNGVCNARNVGAKLAAYDWLIFLDADDYFDQDAILNYTKILKECSKNKVGMVTAAYFNCLKNKLIVPRLRDEPFFNGHRINFLAGAYCVSKSVFFEVGGFDLSIKHSENWELFIRLSRYFEINNFKVVDKEFKSFTYNNLYTNNQVVRKQNDKIVSYIYMFDKYSKLSLIPKVYLSKFASIVASNSFRRQNRRRAIYWQFTAIVKYPFDHMAYVRLLKYLFWYAT